MRRIHLMFPVLAIALVGGCGYESEVTPANQANDGANATAATADTTAAKDTSGDLGTPGGSAPSTSAAEQAAERDSTDGGFVGAEDTGTGTLAVRLNLNTASEVEFMTIPEMSHRMCHEFEEYRPYISIEQFRREMGKYVGDDVIAEYEKYVFVPVAYDDCDAETLQQLPGVTGEIATALMEERPFESSDVFLDALGAYVGVEELALAAEYIVE